MLVFMVRTVIFCLFWFAIIYQDSNNIPISMLMFTLSLGLWFFLSMKKNEFILYSLITIILFFHSLIWLDSPNYSILLMIYLLVIATFSLVDKLLYVLLLMVIVVTLTLNILGDTFIIEWFIVIGLIAFLMIKLNRMVLDRTEQRAIYEELLAEYRQMKRSHFQSKREARLEERTRIARDIHDSVGHKLTALIMKLEMLAIQQNNVDYKLLKEMARESMNDTRKAVQALQVEETEGIPAVVHLIRKLESESHIQVNFTMKQGILTIPLTNKISVVLYRVIQEALTNAMRHAQAREIDVTLGIAANGDLSFEIKNAVFDDKKFELGFGLTNMKERVEQHSGRIDIYRTADEFIVIGRLPTRGEES